MSQLYSRSILFVMTFSLLLSSSSYAAGISGNTANLKGSLSDEEETAQILVNFSEQDTSLVRLFKCPYEGCSYATRTNGNLTNHIGTHTGERPYKCTECDYAAIRKHHLTDHMRTHTGERPFKCSHEGCKYAAARKSSLTNHQRTHTGEKPFNCIECTFAAADRSNLIRHMRTHIGEKRYKCNQCGYASSTSSNLNNHMRKHECNAEMPAAKRKKTS